MLNKYNIQQYNNYNCDCKKNIFFKIYLHPNLLKLLSLIFIIIGHYSKNNIIMALSIVIFLNMKCIGEKNITNINQSSIIYE